MWQEKASTIKQAKERNKCPTFKSSVGKRGKHIQKKATIKPGKKKRKKRPTFFLQKGRKAQTKKNVKANEQRNVAMSSATVLPPGTWCTLTCSQPKFASPQQVRHMSQAFLGQDIGAAAGERSGGSHPLLIHALCLAAGVQSDKHVVPKELLSAAGSTVGWADLVVM